MMGYSPELDESPKYAEPFTGVLLSVSDQYSEVDG